MTKHVVFVPGLPGSDLHVRGPNNELGPRCFVPRPFTKMATMRPTDCPFGEALNFRCA